MDFPSTNGEGGASPFHFHNLCFRLSDLPVIRHLIWYLAKTAISRNEMAFSVVGHWDSNCCYCDHLLE